MRRQARILLVGSLVAWSWFIGRAAWGTNQDLIAHLPTAGNVLVLIDATRIYGSAIAQREHWQADHARGVSAGGLLLPPGTQRVAAAANLDLEFLEPLWEAGVLKVTAVPPLAEIAKAEHGTLDEVNGHQAVFLPNDSCIVTFDAQHLGVMTPANRQRIAQWLEFDPAKSGTGLAPYIKEIQEAEADHPSALALAFNLEHLVPPSTIKTHVAEWSSDRLKGVTPDELAAMLTSLRGASIQIHIGDGIVGRLRVDFGANVERLSPIAKELVLETLAGSGAMMSELRDWELKMEPRAIVLQGHASTRAVERALSIVQLPLAPLGSRIVPTAIVPTSPASTVHVDSEPPVKARSKVSSVPKVSPEDSTPAAASAIYFHAVQRLLTDLKQDKNDAISMGQIGLWYDTYARKIDMLAHSNVDSALIDYGGTVATSLRSAAGAIKQGGIDAHQREMQITPLNTTTVRYSRPNYGGYGGHSRYGYHRGSHRYGSGGRYGGPIGSYYFQSRNVASERLKVRADEKAKMAKSVVSILSDIDVATAKIRQQMIEKYGREF